MNKAKDGIDWTDDISADDVRAACELILASEMFFNAPRLSRLLRFLVEQAISGTTQDTSEYAIGIEVFDRDPSDYTTSEDPIVRVQIGRLRGKLKAYYASLGVGANIEITIPAGCYMPSIRRSDTMIRHLKHSPIFSIHPFKCISQHGNGEFFTHGLHDELVHQLFQTFGGNIVAHSPLTPACASYEQCSGRHIAPIGVMHRLEGSVQIDTERMRASIRLIDATQGCIAWSEQFNRNASLSISRQEELASSICDALKRFFCCESLV